MSVAWTNFLKLGRCAYLSQMYNHQIGNSLFSIWSDSKRASCLCRFVLIKFLELHKLLVFVFRFVTKKRFPAIFLVISPGVVNFVWNFLLIFLPKEVLRKKTMSPNLCSETFKKGWYFLDILARYNRLLSLTSS